jgi:cell wall-associated NlpC family hydrolase
VLYSAQQSLGLKLPPRSYDIALFGIDVPRNNLQVGDLVFFNTLGRRNSHVGVYLGDDQFVHSPSAGGVVRIEDMKMAYWTKRYNGARRL